MSTIQKFKVQLLFLVAFLSIIIVSLLSKHCDIDDNFSGTYIQVTLLVLIIFMITTFKNYRLILLLFASAIIFYYKDYLIIINEGFGDKILENELKGAKLQLEQSMKTQGKLEEKEKILNEKLSKAEEIAADSKREQKNLEREIVQLKGTNDSNSNTSKKEKCDNAKEVMKNKLDYTSKVQKKAQKTIEECMESFSNLAGFNSDNLISNTNNVEKFNNINHMIANFKTLNGSKNSIERQLQFITPTNNSSSNSKITTEGRLFPINTRYF